MKLGSQSPCRNRKPNDLVLGMPRASIKWVIKHDEKLCKVEMSEQTRITRVLEYWCCLFSRSSEVRFEVNLIPSLLDYIYFVDILT